MIVIMSALLIMAGLYLKFVYDTPDAQDKTNRLASWATVVAGIGGVMAGLLIRPKNPMETGDNAETGAGSENQSNDDRSRIGEDRDDGKLGKSNKGNVGGT
jgi:hypothetical protein